jgi:hypothetical protein
MGVQSITAGEIVRGLFELLGDAFKHEDCLEYRNGRSSASFDGAIAAGDPTLWASIIKLRKVQDVQNPPSRSFVTGYNEKAHELGIPAYNSR